MSIRFAALPLESRGGGDPLAARGRERAQGPRSLAAHAASALLAEGEARDGLEQLLQGGALSVTTGQQAGLFTGPLYTILKGFTAAALARELGQRLGRPVVPVFWVAGDDHDFAEINHCTVLGADGKAHRLVLRERDAGAPMLPAFREPVGPEGALALARLEELLPPSEFRQPTGEWLARAYAPDASMAEACARALAGLLGPLGVVVCRGWDGGLKRAAAPVLLGAARMAGRLDEALAAAAQGLQRSGAKVPVEVGNGLSLLMVEGAEGRDRLRMAGEGGFVTRRSGEAFDVAALEALLESDPERVSANVLLRPAVEAHLFSTVAYVGGPGELAYLAQAEPVFELLEIDRPARLPRLSGVLVEAKVDRVLEKLALSSEDLAQPESDLASRIARQNLPRGAAEALEGLRRAIDDGYAALAGEAAGLDRTLERPVENARNQALLGTREVEKKLVAALKRSSDTALQQLARAREALYPEGRAQDRVLTVASFLSRHGDAVRDLLWREAQAHARALLEGHPPRT